MQPPTTNFALECPPNIACADSSWAQLRRMGSGMCLSYATLNPVTCIKDVSTSNLDALFDQIWSFEVDTTGHTGTLVRPKNAPWACLMSDVNATGTLSVDSCLKATALWYTLDIADTKFLNSLQLNFSNPSQPTTDSAMKGSPSTAPASAPSIGLVLGIVLPSLLLLVSAGLFMYYRKKEKHVEVAEEDWRVSLKLGGRKNGATAMEKRHSHSTVEPEVDTLRSFAISERQTPSEGSLGGRWTRFARSEMDPGLDSVQIPAPAPNISSLVANINRFYLALGGQPFSDQPVMVNRVLVAVTDFEPSLTDELELREGMEYHVELLWGDGW
ncbi:hypothetical protein HDU93_007012, partial [Gonapodya sp. JEL0774]